MTVHEAMHGFMAYWLGDDTAKRLGRLTFNPIKHIDPFLTILLPMTLAVTNALTGIHTPIFGGAKPVPFNPARVKYDEWGAALVALAGPLVNLVIAFIAFMILAFTDSVSAQLLAELKVALDAPALSGVLIQFVLINLGFFVFNMLPIPPLDGSRVIYAIAPEFVRRGMESIERFGIIFVFAIVLLASEFIGQIMGTVITGILKLFSIAFGVA